MNEEPLCSQHLTIQGPCCHGLDPMVRTNIYIDACSERFRAGRPIPDPQLQIICKVPGADALRKR